MIRHIKSIKISTLVIVSLLVLNIVVFSLVSSGIKHKHPTTDAITTNYDNNNYFKKGVSVLDWSYTLLKYFRK
ncbi:hypothetical protein OAD66_07715 [Bacteroidia bacterium]|nr:hypothetical protein [Bacteroidia bacterium]